MGEKTNLIVGALDLSQKFLLLLRNKISSDVKLLLLRFALWENVWSDETSDL